MAGWRIDVANMTGRYLSDDFNKEVARGIRDAMDKENPEAWLVAENADFSAEDLDGFGWHGTMNYNGFTMPLWQWIHDKDAKLQDHGRMPGKLPKFLVLLWSQRCGNLLPVFHGDHLSQV